MKYRTPLVIVTDEPVTPAHIATRIAEAAGRYNALRPGESIETEDGRLTLTIVASQADQVQPSCPECGARPGIPCNACANI